jgi:hypothetical protein
MIGFVHPLFLWALAGLALPVTIHLLNRKQGKVTYLGSLRYFQRTPTRQFKSIRLNELLLLALRLLSVVLLVLLLSGLQWTTSPGKGEKWLLIENGLTRDSHLQPTFDSLSTQGYQAHILAWGFPPLQDSASSSGNDSYWALVDALPAKSLQDIIVFSKNRAENFYGHRSALPPNVRWIPREADAMRYALQATRSGHDTVLVRVGFTRGKETSFETVVDRSGVAPINPAGNSDTVRAAVSEPLSVLLIADSSFETDRKIVRAALLAIRQTVPLDIKILKQISDTCDWKIVLGGPDRPPSKTARKGIIRYQPMTSASLFKQTGYQQWALTHRLDQEVALQRNFTFELLKILSPANKLWAKAKKMDRRTIDGSMAWAPRSAGRRLPADNGMPRALDTMLAIFFLLVLIIERFLSYSRNQ